VLASTFRIKLMLMLSRAPREINCCIASKSFVVVFCVLALNYS
jgi:hypothetical protein